MCSRGKSSFEHDLLRLVKSTQIVHFPFLFRTMTTFESHSGYWISLMTFASSRRSTSALVLMALSSDIFLSFFFQDLASGLSLNLCLIRSLLTPARSLVDQAKMFLFAYRNVRMSDLIGSRSSVPSNTEWSVLFLLRLTLSMGSSADSCWPCIRFCWRGCFGCFGLIYEAEAQDWIAFGFSCHFLVAMDCYDACRGEKFHA